ncbi:MAG: DUF4271 domain-containing protein [Bacteroidales bacterium]|nr:DUF4271 domain-containing protein [Bacteroidales bacterium]
MVKNTGKNFDNNNPEKSLFVSHQLNTNNISPNYTQSLNNKDWILGILILCFFLFALVQVLYKKRIKQIFKSFFIKRYTNQLIRDGNLFNERITINLFIIFVLTFSLLIFKSAEFFIRFPQNIVFNFILYLKILIIFFILWFIKILAVIFIGRIFKLENMSKEYLLNILIFNLISGIFLLPSLVLITYIQSTAIIYIVLIMIGLIILYRIIRGIFIGLSCLNFSLLYLILYLCTLEILPFLILTKLVMDYLT